jgi:hypothetical protein
MVARSQECPFIISYLNDILAIEPFVLTIPRSRNNFIVPSPSCSMGCYWRSRGSGCSMLSAVPQCQFPHEEEARCRRHTEQDPHPQLEQSPAQLQDAQLLFSFVSHLVSIGSVSNTVLHAKPHAALPLLTPVSRDGTGLVGDVPGRHVEDGDWLVGWLVWLVEYSV